VIEKNAQDVRSLMFSKRMEATRTMVAICSLSKKAFCRSSLDGGLDGVAAA
jgi:hypothetical protein